MHRLSYSDTRIFHMKPYTYLQDCNHRTPLSLLHWGQNPLHQFPHSKSVTSWRGQKSVASSCCVVSFTNFHFNDLLPTSWQLRSPSTVKLRGHANVCNGFWALCSSAHRMPASPLNACDVIGSLCALQFLIHTGFMALSWRLRSVPVPTLVSSSMRLYSGGASYRRGIGPIRLTIFVRALLRAIPLVPQKPKNKSLPWILKWQSMFLSHRIFCNLHSLLCSCQ